MDSSFQQHQFTNSGYKVNSYYQSKEKFLNNYLTDRLESYHDFIKTRITKCQTILSVASGRCINESHLVSEGGYKIDVSELELPASSKAITQLFPGLNFIQLDIINSIPEIK